MDYIKCMDSKFYGLTINDLRCIVFDFVSKKKIKNPFNSEKGTADRDFVAGFLNDIQTFYFANQKQLPFTEFLV